MASISICEESESPVRRIPIGTRTFVVEPPEYLASRVLMKGRKERSDEIYLTLAIQVEGRRP